MSRASQITYKNNIDQLRGQQRRAYQALYRYEHLRPQLGLTHTEVWEGIQKSYHYPPNYRHNIVARLGELFERGVLVKNGDMFARPGVCRDVCTLWHTTEAMLGPKPKPPEPLEYWGIVYDIVLKKRGILFRRQPNADKAFKEMREAGEPVQLVELVEKVKRRTDEGTNLDGVRTFIPLTGAIQ